MRAQWWWIDRWQKSTAYKDMTLAEQGAYRNLLDELCLRDGVIPNDERILARISGGPFEWSAVRERVMARFVLTERGWTHPTHDEVAAQSKSYRDAQTSAGRARASRAPRDARGRLQPAGPDRVQPAGPAGWAGNHQPSDQPPSPSPSPEQTQTQMAPPPPPAPQGVASDPAPAAASPEPSESADSPKRRRTTAQPAEVVAARPEYGDLLADVRAAEAWQSWLEWCDTAGARPKRPVGQQAARILNEARRAGAERFAAAVDCAIAGNYLAPTYRDAPRSAVPVPHKSHGDRAADDLGAAVARAKADRAAGREPKQLFGGVA